MDLHLKQWKRHQQQQKQQRDEDESEDQHTPSAKFPKLLLPPHPQQLYNDNNKDHPPPLSSSSSAGSTLPLFVPDRPPHQSSNSSSSSPPSPSMGSYFSWSQWQELELQALIYRYMLSGAPIPPGLLHPIKNSVAHQPPLFLQQNHPHLSYFLHRPHSQPFRFQSGYWGRASMDPQPGRCRRTDGKKWRCSRDVVPGQKYCERHVHRGRNRSRKPVEISPTPGTCAAAAATNSTDAVASFGFVASESHSGITRSSQRPIDLFQTNKSHYGPITGAGARARADPGGSQVLRHFFDDWPRTFQEPDVGSLTALSMSIAGNPSSDVSLKMSTGDGETDRTRGSSWLTGWSSSSRATSVGGPLAEALRSSATTTMDHSSPTSVLHRPPCGLAAEPGLMTQV